MDTVKGRNGMNLTEAEDIKKRCQEYTEDSAGAAGLEKVSFHSNPKERQGQRMLKLPHNYTHLTD